MSKQTINVGNTPNDRKGDSLRSAFLKVNANFTELYTTLGLDELPLNLGAFEFSESVNGVSTISTTDSSAIVIDQATTVTSDLTVGGDVVPSIANGGDLGSLAKPWRSLYVSSSTVYFGGVPLSLDENNNLLVNNVPISQTIIYADIPDAPAAFSGSYADLTNKPTIPADIGDLTDTGNLLSSGSADNLSSEGDINIRVNLTDSTTRVWRFGEDGNLEAPGEITASAYRTSGNNIAVGQQAALTNQGAFAVAIGDSAGLTNQGISAVALGPNAGGQSQGVNTVAVGVNSGYTSQGSNAVALGNAAGYDNQETAAIAIGQSAGEQSQSEYAVAIGYQAGQTSQNGGAIAIGFHAGLDSQSISAVAIGGEAGQNNQGQYAVAIGDLTGNTSQGNSAVAIGDQAGQTSQGDYAVGIGYKAGEIDQAINSIVINATGSAVNNTTANSFMVKPVRSAAGTSILQYDSSTGEISHTNEIYSDQQISITVAGEDSTQKTWYFGNDGDLTAPGDITLDGVVKHSTIEKTGGASSETPTALDLTKSVQVLVSANTNDDSWSLADGVEGQIMYFVPKGAGLNNHYINIANVRYFSEGGYTVGPKTWIPFQIDDNLRAEDWRSLAVAVFTDGAWNTDTSWFD